MNIKYQRVWSLTFKWTRLLDDIMEAEIFVNLGGKRTKKTRQDYELEDSERAYLTSCAKASLLLKCFQATFSMFRYLSLCQFCVGCLESFYYHRLNFVRLLYQNPQDNVRVISGKSRLGHKNKR